MNLPARVGLQRDETRPVSPATRANSHMNDPSEAFGSPGPKRGISGSRRSGSARSLGFGMIVGDVRGHLFTVIDGRLAALVCIEVIMGS